MTPPLHQLPPPPTPHPAQNQELAPGMPNTTYRHLELLAKVFVPRGFWEIQEQIASLLITTVNEYLRTEESNDYSRFFFNISPNTFCVYIYIYMQIPNYPYLIKYAFHI